MVLILTLFIALIGLSSSFALPLPASCCCGCTDNCPKLLIGCPSPRDPCPAADVSGHRTIPPCIGNVVISPADAPIARPKHIPMYRYSLEELNDVSPPTPYQFATVLHENDAETTSVLAADSQIPLPSQPRLFSIDAKSAQPLIHVTKILRMKLDESQEPKNVPSFVSNIATGQVEQVHSGELSEAYAMPNDASQFHPIQFGPKRGGEKTKKKLHLLKLPQTPQYYRSLFDADNESDKISHDAHLLMRAKLKLFNLDAIADDPFGVDNKFSIDELAKVKISRNGSIVTGSGGNKEELELNSVASQLATLNFTEQLEAFPDITDHRSEKLYQIDGILSDIERMLIALRNEVIVEQESLTQDSATTSNYSKPTLIQGNEKDVEKTILDQVPLKNVEKTTLNQERGKIAKSILFNIKPKRNITKLALINSIPRIRNMLKMGNTVLKNVSISAARKIVQNNITRTRAKVVDEKVLKKGTKNGKGNDYFILDTLYDDEVRATEANNKSEKIDKKMPTPLSLPPSSEFKAKDVPQATIERQRLIDDDLKNLASATLELTPLKPLPQIAAPSNETLALKSTLERTTSKPAEAITQRRQKTKERKTFEETVAWVLKRIEEISKNDTNERAYLLDKLLNNLPNNHHGANEIRTQTGGPRRRRVRQTHEENEYHCNSDQLRTIIENNIDGSDAVLSKHRVQNSAESTFSGRFDVVCSREQFTYVVSSRLFCEAAKDGVVCFAFLSEHPIKP